MLAFGYESRYLFSFGVQSLSESVFCSSLMLELDYELVFCYSSSGRVVKTVVVQHLDFRVKLLSKRKW